jgi:hypothetical protein
MSENEETEAKTSKKKRPRGRPKGRFDPRLDWDKIETEFIHGISQGPTKKGAKVARHWPTYRELSERHGVSPSLVHRKAKRYGWDERRDLTQKAFTSALDAYIAKAAALSTAEQVQYIDEYIRRFGQNIRKGKVRADVFLDLDKATRLREFLLGNADSRTENNNLIKLDALQSRFKDRQIDKRAQAEAEAAAAIAGVVTNADPIPIEAEQIEGDPFLLPPAKDGTDG